MNTETDIEVESGSEQFGGRRLNLRAALIDLAESHVKPYTAEENDRAWHDLCERIAQARRRPWHYRFIRPHASPGRMTRW